MLTKPLTSEAQLEFIPLQPYGMMVRHPTGQGNIRDIPVATLQEWARKHRILLLRGFTPFPDSQTMTEYAASWGELMKWSFGVVLELTEQENPKDHLFDHKYLPLHWDGMYAQMIPAYQFFQCVKASPAEMGGQTTFSDTARVLANISPATRARWEKVSITYRLKQSSFYGGALTSPLITPHPETGEPIMRFNEPAPEHLNFLNQAEMTFHGVAAGEEKKLVEELREILYDPRHLYKHQWVAGDILATDNYTLLHGRTAFVSKTPRHLRRIHVLGKPPFRNPALHPAGT